MNNAQKIRSRKNIAGIIAAAAAVFCLTCAAGAAGVIDLRAVFGKFFSAQDGGELNAMGMTECSKTIDTDYYTVEVKGIIADSISGYIYYDVAYKDDIYFENGELKEEYKGNSPVMFMVSKSGAGGGGRSVPKDGKTSAVSYIQNFSANFDKDIFGKYKISLRCDCFKELLWISPPEKLTAESFNVSVPPAKELTVDVNREITVLKWEGTLRRATVSPLSVSFDKTLPYEYYNYDFDKDPDGIIPSEYIPFVLIKMKDGTVIDPCSREWFAGSGGGSFSFDPDTGAMTEEPEYFNFAKPVDISQIEAMEYYGCTFDMNGGKDTEH